ncbi:cystatin-like [Microplitis mediator]|uniref:cystatin-like n=1 Tax=Microplitis mediator TaxID=375433 RepID=UPI002554812A|nr:cystatin-like [Microplitis mediator]
MSSQYQVFKVILVCLILQIVLSKSARNIPGGPQPIPVDSSEVQEYAKKGLTKFSSTYQGTNEPVIAEIISASRKVVSGTLYEISVRFGESNCPKGQYGETCLLAENGPIKECLITAWSRPWLEEDSLTIDVKCD